MADAKAVDAQMGAEKALAATAAGLAGANMVYESSGMMASLLGASFEAFVLDNEMLSHVHRAIRGVEVSEETYSALMLLKTRFMVKAIFSAVMILSRPWSEIITILVLQIVMIRPHGRN